MLSLTNNAEIQVKYDIDNQMSNWKVNMETYMEDILKKHCDEIEADFKAKDPTPSRLREKIKQLEVESHATSTEQMKNFIDYIDKKTFNQTIYKNWEQKCINKVDMIRERITEDCQRRLSVYYNHEKNGAKWRDELQQSKNKLQDNARKYVNGLLREKEKEAGENMTPEFSNYEIERKFSKFWGSVKDGFNFKKEKAFVPDNVPLKIANEIRSRYGHVISFTEISNKFGVHLQNKFKIEWVKFSHVEFIGNVISRSIKHKVFSDQKCFQNMQDLIATAESKLLLDVVGLYDVGGLMKMNFQSDSVIFDCGTLVKKYLTKAIDLLVEAHEKSQ